MRARIAVALVMCTLALLSACTSTDEPGADGSFLSEGDHAPDFTLPSAAGEDVSLNDFANQKPVLLYFSMGPG